jgi:hypothetical protein
VVSIRARATPAIRLTAITTANITTTPIVEYSNVSTFLLFIAAEILS